MNTPAMTSLVRVLTTLGHREPDRVPVFLLTTMHGAKELGLSLPAYFANPAYVAEGQLRLFRKFRGDGLSNFFYAAVEIEAWGGEVIYTADGPPNAGAPVLRNAAQIRTLTVPDVRRCPSLLKVLHATEQLKAHIQDAAPIIGVVMSPFSLPVMQMGFEAYLQLIYEQPALFAQLMAINEAFCVQWANAQLDAGATAICYFDPVSSPSIIPRDLYRQTGFAVAARTLRQIHGPTATHLASGRGLPILDDLAQTGTAVVGVSCLENLAAIKAACREKLTVLGNLNGIEMARWTPAQAAQIVKTAIAQAAPGGGFILSDSHGEIPFQVTDETLFAIMAAVERWGRYPLTWVAEYAQ